MLKGFRQVLLESEQLNGQTELKSIFCPHQRPGDTCEGRRGGRGRHGHRHAGEVGRGLAGPPRGVAI